jgi:hypothetical protein
MNFFKCIVKLISTFPFLNDVSQSQSKEPKELVFNSDETNMVQREIFLAKRYHALSDKC